jgi:serine phosphatase RsbU (regulator of sigma subunit)
VKNAVDICRNNKQSVVYESFLTKNSNEKTWLQTTLTPILNRDNEITKLIAIETDISKLKNAEEEIASQRDMLKFQNEQITDSIEYAKTIQSAILPDLNYIANFFSIFAIYYPKDIVSGDFYWFSHINSGENNYDFFAVVDCTGHGVPGAFMSLIGNRLLNEIINEKKILQPGTILDELDKGVLKALQQKHTLIDDGMDISLCRIEKNTEGADLIFSGAKRPIHYFSKSENKLDFIKGSKKSIGGICSLRGISNFEENSISLYKGDAIYLHTDGFTDQNSPERKRFGRKRLNDTINNIVDKPMRDQKIYLERILSHWQNTAKQRDDITLIGIQI